MTTELRHVNPSGIAAAPSYSHAVQIISGQPVFISGQVPLDKDGNLVGAGDIEAQITQVFTNLGLILSDLGIGFDNVVKFTYFLTDINHAQDVRRIRSQYINAERPPASSLVQVSSLYRPDIMIEIEAVAVVPVS